MTENDDRVWALVEARTGRYAPVAFDTDAAARRYGAVHGLGIPDWLPARAPRALFAHDSAGTGPAAHYAYDPQRDPRGHLLPSLEHPSAHAGPLDGPLPRP